MTLTLVRSFPDSSSFLKEDASFFWNVRGLNKSSKHSVIKKWVEEGRYQFGCLLETRVKEGKALRIGKKIFKDWSLLSNYEYNRLGRIWVVWKENVRLTPFFKSSQLITCSVKLEEQNEEFFCSFVYASNFEEERKTLWADLRNHHDSPVVRNRPWMIMGDFNDTLDMDEHSRVENMSIISSGMRDFRGAMNYCKLKDLAYHGPLYTWCNKRENDLILKKLDRVLVNEKWLPSFPQSYTVFEAGGCSDHLRSRTSLNSETITSGTRRPYKFVNAIAEMMEFQPLIKEHWEGSETIYLSTSSLHRFSRKLKMLKPKIRLLAKEKMGRLSKRTKEAYEDLCKKQEENLARPSTSAMAEENEAYAKWDHVARIEEKFLKQRSKLHWLAVGDLNNKTFHRAVVAREAVNSIREIITHNGSVVSSREEIKEEAEHFFKDFLQTIPETYEGMTVKELEDLLPFRCTPEDNKLLIREVTGDEIKKVLFSMPNDKSPGPDGYTTEFYKAAWGIIGSEFVTAIQSFFAKGFLPKGLNSTILALIPKKKEAKEMKDYRPISCCNVLYKVISKIIANRLKRILPKFIVGNQSAFVKDRLLIENVLLATELVKDYHKEDVSTRCAMKIDISKAFDSLQWSFLINVLTAMNFSPEFIHWIARCITTASFSVQVNGELAGYFRSARGLRQGCSLSPYLFVISMNVLSKMLDKAAGAREFGYHPRCKTLGLTHLCFADDLMILTDGKVRSVDGIVNVLNLFANRSGLKMSMEKTTLYTGGVSDGTRQLMVSRYPFGLGQLPVRYLGLPLVTRRLTTGNLSPLLDQIRNRIGTWTASYLSFAGRLNLISSVLWSIVNFWMNAYRLPRECIKELEKICSAFLWSGPELNTHKAKVSWEVVCKPMKEGGLGLRSLKEANDVCCLKLIWRLLSNSDSLWVRWSRMMLLKKESFWSFKETSSLGSWMWKKLMKYRDLAKSFCKVEVQNGVNTSFWFDNWMGEGSLIEKTGPRGVIDMGIGKYMTVAEAWGQRRRRRHRTQVLNDVEEALAKTHQARNERDDMVLWRGKGDVFKSSFSTKDTWNHIRTSSNHVAWEKGVWFPHATPKFSFCTWLALLDRLSTGDRMQRWNNGSTVSCGFCAEAIETRNHLFFSCPYSYDIWKTLAQNILNNQFTEDWQQIVTYISATNHDRVHSFLVRNTFQITVHTIWRERNARRHGEVPRPATTLISWIDKHVRNQLSVIRSIGDRRYDLALQAWFASHAN